MAKKYLLRNFIALFIFVCCIPSEASVSDSPAVWGFFGHKRINRMATFTLPPEIFSFFKQNIEYVTEHAVDPDKRRYATEGEAQRHYIDIDHYAKDGEDPFVVMPKQWNDAVDKYSEDTIQEYGIVPWHIEVMVNRLTKAFRSLDTYYILKVAADLGHYIGDAHVPLHTTVNYNGQLTDQKGIHGFWESRLPEIYADDYDYFTGRARYIEDLNGEIWEAIQESHNAVDSVLFLEKELSRTFSSDGKYSYEKRGSRTVKVYSEDFSAEYNQLMGDMVERRLRKSIIMVGSAWYTAWVNAGQPDLDALDNLKLTEEVIQQQKILDENFNQGKIKGREHDH